ncbi:hypothetical protein M2139_000951 [Enterococcus sp. PF1-24]|uniref:heparinase II/III family protein n=1 Tax=unclassified Enterococcus TaxID=2608891 RepID=UPI0024757763|nr:MULTISPECIES: heparinase II/III family protein [unclassified Enterococcus]MDH6363966.1 hypothetical protein [Enterococcus sp. PFB1-1]MDH6401067.1 hypothetical protein [Enterococcus sp. PF1-24]
MKKIQTTLKKQIIAAADEYCEAGTIPFLTPTGYTDYLKNGERLVFEKQYFARRRQLAVLGLAVHLETNDERLRLLETTIWEICNEYSWALPAHLPITGENFGSASPCWIDLFAAETAQALAEIKNLLKEKLSPLIQERIEREIEQRIFVPFESFSWEWERKENNWSSVIAGSIGMAALLLLPVKSARQLKIIQRLDLAMQSYLKGFADDGVCVEGVGYWAYGFGYYVYYAEMLARILGENKYLVLEKAKAIAKFPAAMQISGNNFVPFSDYNESQLPSGLVSFCQKNWQVTTPVLRGISKIDFDHCYRFAHIYRNLIWTEETIFEETSEKSTTYFSDSQWLTVKYPQQKFFFATKGGSNAESHNHNDLGHFILSDDSELFLTDLGAGKYTKQYFDEAYRYEFLVNRSNGHSVPIINQQEQMVGAVSAKQVEFVEVEDKINFGLNLESVYPATAEISSCSRFFEVLPKEKKVILRDAFEFVQPENKVVENFVSLIIPEVIENKVKLAGKEACLYIFSEAAKPVILSEKFYDHQGIERTAYLIRFHYQCGKQLVTKLYFEMVKEK